MEHAPRSQMQPPMLDPWHALPLFVTSPPKDKGKHACVVRPWRTFQQSRIEPATLPSRLAAGVVRTVLAAKVSVDRVAGLS